MAVHHPSEGARRFRSFFVGLIDVFAAVELGGVGQNGLLQRIEREYGPVGQRIIQESSKIDRTGFQEVIFGNIKFPADVQQYKLPDSRSPPVPQSEEFLTRFNCKTTGTTNFDVSLDYWYVSFATAEQ